LVALLVSALTLFSGFGLGTLLMPAYALFFPLPLAIAATAVVHLANNIFKTVLVGRNADWRIVLKFALPAAIAAIMGATLLSLFAGLPVLTSYEIGGQKHEIYLLKLIVGVLIIGFACLDLVPGLSNMAFDRKYLPIGGLLSGFFGGLSGIQGALRSAFLIKAGLEKEAFIGTGTVSAVIVDVSRLLIYGLSFYTMKISQIESMSGIILAAIIAAFVGSFVGVRLMKKVTLQAVQIMVGVMLIIVGIGMATGLF
jgi:uncharacterized membrane protein YfcA